MPGRPITTVELPETLALRALPAYETLAAALAAFQMVLPQVRKDSKVNAGARRYRYADLADISPVVLPLLAYFGLSYTCAPLVDDNGWNLHCTLAHTSGETLTALWPLPAASGTTGNFDQTLGSAITYGRRYCLLALTGVAPHGDDDDAASVPPGPRDVGRPQQSGATMALVTRWRASGWTDEQAAAQIRAAYGRDLAALSTQEQRGAWAFFRDHVPGDHNPADPDTPDQVYAADLPADDGSER